MALRAAPPHRLQLQPLHAARRAHLSLSAATFGNESSTRADVPLPLVGVRYDHRFSERWSAGASLAAFALKFGSDTFHFQGSLVSARLHAEYRFSQHFAVGGALDAFKVDVDLHQADWKGGFDYGYWGPQVYLTARF